MSLTASAPWWTWVLTGVAVWFVVSVWVGIFIGRVMRDDRNRE